MAFFDVLLVGGGFGATGAASQLERKPRYSVTLALCFARDVSSLGALGAPSRLQ